MFAVAVTILVAHRAIQQSAASTTPASCTAAAVYSINLETQWSAETHPRAFTGTDAAFEDIHGTTRSSRGHWISPAQQIQCGGETSGLDGSFQAKTFCPQPGMCEAEMQLSVSNETSFLSLHSFISPTADWFVSISDFELCQENQWITSARIPLFPYNEGTLEVPDCKIHDQDAAKQDLSTNVFLTTNSSMWVDDDIAATRPLGHVTIARVGNWEPHPSAVFLARGIYPPDMPLPVSGVYPPAATLVQQGSEDQLLDQSFPGASAAAPGAAAEEEHAGVLWDRDGVPIDVISPCSGTAQYDITVDVTWTHRTHPLAPQAEPFWQPLVLFTHDLSVQMYSVGGLASPGLAEYLSSASTTALEKEQAYCRGNNTCTSIHYGECGAEAGGVCVLHGGIEVAPIATRLSLAMLASPSPDWFVGVHDYPLCQAGQWVETAAAALYLLDGGVVQGITWEPQQREATVPQEAVRIVGRGTSAWNPELGQAVSMGSVRLQLVASEELGAAVQPVDMGSMLERDLWASNLMGPQFPELDMLPPFVHDGSELSGWQPPNLNLESSRGGCAAVAVWAQLLGCLGLLWLVVLS